MRVPDEKQGFAARLNAALKRSWVKVTTPTELAAQFSIRYPSLSVTAQAAHKWLSGGSLPSSDKIDALAEWLRVEPQWLRHGIAAAPRPAPVRAALPAKEPAPLTAAEWTLLERLRRLPPARRELVEEIVAQFDLDENAWQRP
jgi:transcriptional regulator with XRE-family HTH domain